MFQRITKISFLLLSIATAGLIGATMHYHSDAVLCLEHGDTPHLSTNEQLCPVSVLNLDDDAVSPAITSQLHEVEDPLLIIPEFALSFDLSTFRLGRAPPSLV